MRAVVINRVDLAIEVYECEALPLCFHTDRAVFGNLRLLRDFDEPGHFRSPSAAIPDSCGLTHYPGDPGVTRDTAVIPCQLRYPKPRGANRARHRRSGVGLSRPALPCLHGCSAAGDLCRSGARLGNTSV